MVSLSNNVELLTAIANDLAYEEVFAYQLQSQSQPGDVLVAISSSGRSANIVKALTWALDNGLHTIAITGFDGGAARNVAEVAIHAECSNYGVIEDLHQAVMHALAQYIRPVAHDGGGRSQRLCSEHGHALRNQPPDRESQPSVRRPLVLDSGHTGDREAARQRRRTHSASEPEVADLYQGYRPECAGTSRIRGRTSGGHPAR